METIVPFNSQQRLQGNEFQAHGSPLIFVIYRRPLIASLNTLGLDDDEDAANMPVDVLDRHLYKSTLRGLYDAHATVASILE